MISNDTFLKRRLTYGYVFWNNGFNPDEINKITNICEKEEMYKCETVGNGKNCEDIRKSKIRFFKKNEENDWFFNKFNTIIDSLNNTFYNFDLYGYDSFQYTIYNSIDKGEYNWHMDTVLGKDLGGMDSRSTRKLSLIMLLSEPQIDFSGGEFQLNLSSQECPITPTLRKGDIIAFPSFLLHRVRPVHLGVRKSIVIWVEGPKFR
jgi:PKHD-type hydroxylase